MGQPATTSSAVAPEVIRSFVETASREDSHWDTNTYKNRHWGESQQLPSHLLSPDYSQVFVAKCRKGCADKARDAAPRRRTRAARRGVSGSATRSARMIAALQQ